LTPRFEEVISGRSRMYSRKFGLRLRGKLGKPRMTRMSRMDFLAGVWHRRPTIGCSIQRTGSRNRGTPYLFVSVLSAQSVACQAVAPAEAS